jgi:uncharacterized protein (TIGR00251 family)
MPDIRSYHLHDGKSGSALAVRITPRASRNEIHEILDDGTVKIRITAAPVEGQANQALIDFLSSVLGVPKTKLEIVAGQSGRDKIVAVENMSAKEVQQKILLHLT